MDIVSFLIGYESGSSAGGIVTDVDVMLDEINGESINGKIVTFIGLDGSVLYEARVTPGFDCPDPAGKKIPIPVKESTVANVFTFNGWSLVEGGEADANALKNITTDITVYVAFRTSTRHYKIEFYDDAGKYVGSESVAYMGSATFTHKITGAYFQEWVPNPVNVESDMKCYGVWVYGSFATDSWEQISYNVRFGRATEYYAVGDEREIQLTTNMVVGSTVVPVQETLIIQVVGFNVESGIKDKDDVWKSNSMSIIAKTPPQGSRMKYKTIPEKYDGTPVEDYLYSDQSVSPLWRGFAGSDVLTYLNDVVLPGLPADLRSVLLQTEKVYSHYNMMVGGGTKLDFFKLWIPSLSEVDGYNIGNMHGTVYYPAYEANVTGANDATGSRVATLYGTDTAVSWWLRTYDSSWVEWMVKADGSITKCNVRDEEHYVIFGFCV